ncbi:Alpha/Beta hydrolase protein [Mucidula mucida]|nr:Alpha/Beta hydrolase protein [Mucidula mucida]
MELGPCRVLSADGPNFHNESWNSHVNIFFIDQPVGTGFSYADHGESVSTTEEAAQDIAAFVAIFFEHFPKFKGRAFHLSGESYGGRFLPVYASAIYDQNAYLGKHFMTPINLTSVLIGNGMTDYITMLLSYYDILCTGASLPPMLDIATCVRMKTVYPRCQKWMKEACVEFTMRFERLETSYLHSSKRPHRPCLDRSCFQRNKKTSAAPLRQCNQCTR